MLALSAALSGCDRIAGQSELFALDGKQLKAVEDLNPPAKRADPLPGDGDAVRSNDDNVTFVVESVNLNRLPPRLSGSRDVVVFAEVWEDAATAASFKPLVQVVYTTRNQLVPGKLNFNDAIAYGPTKFKGRPIKVRFTVLVLQKTTSEQEAQALSVMESFAGAAQPAASPVISLVTGALRDVLRRSRTWTRSTSTRS